MHFHMPHISRPDWHLPTLLAILVGGTIPAAAMCAVGYFLNQRTGAMEADADAMVAITALPGLFFGLFLGLIALRCDDEIKRVADAVTDGEQTTFLRWATRRMSGGFKVMTGMMAIYLVASIQLFHYHNLATLLFAEFVVTHMVCVAILVVHDMDDPIGGMFGVRDAPEPWLEMLETCLCIKPWLETDQQNDSIDLTV